MSRVVNPYDPGKERAYLRRTIAEVLRHLVFKRRVDDETKDMTAALVYALRGIAETVETTAAAWEKRDYYLKADRFRIEWEWATPSADRLESIVRAGRWDALPRELAALAPRFADIRIVKMTRDPSVWQSAYSRLVK